MVVAGNNTDMLSIVQLDQTHFDEVTINCLFLQREKIIMANAVIKITYPNENYAYVIIIIVVIIRSLGSLGLFGRLFDWLLNKKLSCRRDTARRFVSLNILLSHSRSFEMIL